MSAKTAVELTAGPTVVNVGKETTFTATIKTEGERADALLAPTGTVEFCVNGESLGDPVDTLDGQVQQTWTGTSVGNYLVTAQFTAADQNYLGAYSEA